MSRMVAAWALLLTIFIKRLGTCQCTMVLGWFTSTFRETWNFDIIQSDMVISSNFFLQMHSGNNSFRPAYVFEQPSSLQKTLN